MKLIDWEHVSKHEPKATRHQVFKLATWPDDKMFEAFQLFMFNKGHQKGKTKATTVRYCDGYLCPSENYEDGPPTIYNEFVAQI